MGGAGKGKGKGGGSRARSQSSGKGKGKGSNGKGSSGKGKASAVEPASKVTDLPVGLDLTAQYSDGLWYKAKVVQIRKKAPQVKVNFMGYDTSMDLWVGEDELRTKHLKKGGKEASAAQASADNDLPAPGASCLADPWQTGEFQAAEVVAVSTNKKRKSAPVKVKIEMWVHPSQLSSVQKVKPSSDSAKNARAASPAPAGGVDIPIGTTLQAMAYDGNWYKATVVKIRKSKAPVRVHFTGCDESLDQWCTLEELYSRHIKKEKAEDSGKAKSKGARNDSKGSGKGGGGQASNASGTSPNPNRRKGKGKGKGKGSRRAGGSGSY